MQELIEKFEELKNKILATKKLLDLEAKKQEIKKLETRVNQPNFWKDQEKARKVSQELSDLNGEVGQWEELHKEVDDGLSLVNEALKTKKQENKKTILDILK